MTATGEAAPPPAAGARKGSRLWKLLIPVLLIAVAAGGGAYWYFMMRHAGHDRAAAAAAEPPLPFYLEVKPFVVSMKGSDGGSHFVQLGVNLTLSGAALGTVVGAMLPELADTMRMTVLSFKLDDIETPPGIDRLRAKITADINRMLLARLGAERIEHANGGHKDAVQNTYFSTLIVE